MPARDLRDHQPAAGRKGASKRSRKALHRDPEYRQKLYSALRVAANRPERKEQGRQLMIERNKDPVFSRRRLEGIQKYWGEGRAPDKGRAPRRVARW